jgi:hypothetical protein
VQCDSHVPNDPGGNVAGGEADGAGRPPRRAVPEFLPTEYHPAIWRSTVFSRRTAAGSVATFGHWPPVICERESTYLSGGNFEQCGDEFRLRLDVTTADVPNLPLPDHCHRLVACQRSSRRPEAAKAKPWTG